MGADLPRIRGMDRIYREDVQGVRASVAKLGAVVAEVDRELRYVWVDNPHPDFDAAAVVGKRDDELLSPSDAEAIMALKREAWRMHASVGQTLRFQRSDGERAYTTIGCPITDAEGRMQALLTVAFETDSA